jgi:catechol 2,3-dioxygenase-like lactoylglutathione lyase family enzyme
MENAGSTVVSLVPLLNVRDVARSVEFYTSVLGFSVLSKWESEGRLAWARIGTSAGVELMINASDVATKEEAAAARRSAHGSFSDVVLYFEVPDVNVLHARLRGLGVSVNIPFDTQYGTREMHARDFDGYEIAFTSPLEAA